MDPKLFAEVQLIDPPNWADMMQGICTLLSVIVTIAGFGFVLQAIHGDTHSKLYAEVGELLKLFLQHPRLRVYFYEGHEIKKDHRDYPAVLTLAEIFVAHFEHVVLQSGNLPADIRPRWAEYIKDMYDLSPIIQEHMKDKGGWYSVRLHKIVNGDLLELDRFG